MLAFIIFPPSDNLPISASQKLVLPNTIFMLYSLLVRYYFGICSVLLRSEPDKQRLSSEKKTSIIRKNIEVDS